MRVYVAGPMRGYPQFNFPAFYKAAKKLRSKGHVVFNPAERDTKIYGSKLAKENDNGDATVAKKKFGFSLREALAADTQWICLRAQAIALLPGWEKSKGAQAELALANALDLKVIFLKG